MKNNYNIETFSYRCARVFKYFMPRSRRTSKPSNDAAYVSTCVFSVLNIFKKRLEERIQIKKKRNLY